MAEPNAVATPIIEATPGAGVVQVHVTTAAIGVVPVRTAAEAAAGVVPVELMDDPGTGIVEVSETA